MAEHLRADDIIDRQRLRRKLAFWRIAALVVLVLAIAAIAARLGGDRFGPKTGPHVARITVSGTITENRRMLEMIEEARLSESVKGVIVTINSPGGTTAGGEALYDAIRELADEKPVAARIGTLAASAGYMVAVASDQIIARKTSIVGSIGVLFQYPNFEGLLDSWGVDVRAIKSSPLKAEPSFFGEPPPGAEEMIRAMVLDSYDWFRDIVAERRGFDAATIGRLSDGSIFTGRQGLENGLVDRLGGEEEAVAWLEENGVEKGLPVIDWEPAGETPGLGLLGSLVRSIAAEAGLQPMGAAGEALNQRLFLDGLVSVWHGSVKQPETQVPPS